MIHRPASTRSPLGRRAFVAGTAWSLAAPGLIRSAAARRLDELVLFGPPAGPSITLAHAIASRRLATLADKVTLKLWRNPDEMRAGLTSRTMDVLIAPTPTVANLYNRGLGVRLVNVMTDGLLYVVAPDPVPGGFPGLAGRRLAMPFRNDAPEFVLNRLMAIHRLIPGETLTVETTGSPIEAMQLLLAGRIDAAMVPEPAATAAVFRGALAGRTVHRAIDVQDAWAAATGSRLGLPLAGLAVTDRFLAENEAVIAALQDMLAAASAAVNANPARAANDAAAVLGLPWPILKDSIPYSNLVATKASAARPALEALFTTISQADPAIIGGRLPDPSFYL